LWAHLCILRASVPSTLVLPASDTAIHHHPRDGIGCHAMATTGPETKQKSHQNEQKTTGSRETNLDNVNLKPDRERILPDALEHLAVHFSSRKPLTLWSRRRWRRTEIARDRWQIFASRRGIRATWGILWMQRGQIRLIVCWLGSGRGRGSGRVR
jgi:hypothetical protein